MAKTNQKSAQQSKTLSLTVFWDDEKETVSFFKYDSEEKTSAPVTVTLVDVADKTLGDLRFVSTRSSKDNGDVLRVYSLESEYRTLANGDLVVSNLHMSRFQPKGFGQ